MMAKSDPTKRLELDPDAWPRFEQFVRALAKSPPQHRNKPHKPKGKKRKSPGKAKARKRKLA